MRRWVWNFSWIGDWSGKNLLRSVLLSNVLNKVRVPKLCRYLGKVHLKQRKEQVQRLYGRYLVNIFKEQQGGPNEYI